MYSLAVHRHHYVYHDNSFAVFSVTGLAFIHPQCPVFYALDDSLKVYLSFMQ